ncbi:hypothetical protein CROQUDRAFT_51744, partial [Cronartium quercuum f. sp. fusiforme G11]
DSPPLASEGRLVVAYVSFSQVANAVVKAMEDIMDMRGEMDDEEWEAYHPTIAENYTEQLARKMAKQQENKASALKY